jgi:hypothetical protein
VPAEALVEALLRGCFPHVIQLPENPLFQITHDRSGIHSGRERTGEADHDADVRQVVLDGFLHSRILNLDGDARTIVEECPVHLADGCRCEWLALERAEHLVRWASEFALEHLLDQVVRHGRSVRL